MLKITIVLAIAVVAGGAFYIGRLSVIGVDILCSGSFQPARLLTDMTDDEGRHLPAGTIITYRSCEKASQARFEFLIDHTDTRSVDVRSSSNPPAYLLYAEPE